MSVRGQARALHAHDAVAARAFVERRLVGSPYLERTLELLEQALSGHPDTRGVYFVDADATGLALFGPVAGANGSWQIRSILITPELERDAGRPLIQATLETMRAEGARGVVAEVPADETIGAGITLLRANGFKQSGRIPDYFRDGVALLFLRREL